MSRTRASTNAKRGKNGRGPVRNRLNDLTGSEWLFATNTLWETSYPPDATHKRRKAHGAMKPPEAMRDIVRFFTKKGERVLDPFAGVGGTLLGAEMAEREALGFEVDPRWKKVYDGIRNDFAFDVNGDLVPADGPTAVRKIESDLLRGDCLQRIRKLDDGSFDAIICDPPYGVDHGATGFTAETNFSMQSTVKGDFGSLPTFEAFLDMMTELGDECARVLRPGKYMVVLIGDRYRKGRFIPLGVRVADAFERNGKFVLKGIRIWTNKTTLRPLRPYAIGSAFVPNITHQNVVILRRAD